MIDFVKANIKNLKAYTSARHQNMDGILLDANENPFESMKYDVEINRYPDPNHQQLKQKIAKKYGYDFDQLTITSGSDEAFDIIYKCFLDPNDEILTPYPTYGMYQVLADILNITFTKTQMSKDFQPDVDDLKNRITERSKCIILCHPSNPIGNTIERRRILDILDFGLPTIIDEAYIDFCISDSVMDLLDQYENLIITRTLSKAYGAAGIRCGYIISSSAMASYFNAIKLPYNLNGLTLNVAGDIVESNIQPFIEYVESQKKTLVEFLNSLRFVDEIFPSKTNFVTFKTKESDRLYSELSKKSIIIRKMSSIKNTIRITIGTPEEMKLLLDELRTYESEVTIA